MQHHRKFAFCRRQWIEIGGFGTDLNAQGVDDGPQHLRIEPAAIATGKVQPVEGGAKEEAEIDRSSTGDEGRIERGNAVLERLIALQQGRIRRRPAG